MGSRRISKRSSLSLGGKYIFWQRQQTTDLQLSSGLLHASFTAHYRSISSLTFTADSRMLLSASQDASVHVFLVSRLVDEDDAGALGKPYGTLKDHTLGIRNVAIGKTAGSHGGRCWTTSDDGTVKVPDSRQIHLLILTGRCGLYTPLSTFWRHSPSLPPLYPTQSLSTLLNDSSTSRRQVETCIMCHYSSVGRS